LVLLKLFLDISRLPIHVLRLTIIGLIAVYPVFVYYGLAHFKPGVFGVALLVLITFRITSIPRNFCREIVIPLGFLMAYMLAIAVANDEVLLRFYPVVVSLTVSYLFGKSLQRPPCMIERLAAIKGIVITTERQAEYMRRLTLVWCIALTVNASVAAYTAIFGSLKFWALYNGLFSYVLIGLLLVTERIYRWHYKRRVAREN